MRVTGEGQSTRRTCPPQFAWEWTWTFAIRDGLNYGTDLSVVIDHNTVSRSRVSSVSAVDRPRFGLSGSRGGIPLYEKKGFVLRPRRLAWPCSFLAKLFRGKVIGAWNKPLPFGANVKNTWSYNLAFQCGFILWAFICPRKCLAYNTWRIFAFLTNKFHGAESFLRSWRCHRISRNPWQFMKPRDS
jgi:hypothetical protein